MGAFVAVIVMPPAECAALRARHLLESELRALAIHLRGEPTVPAAWQRDLDLRPRT